MSNFRKYIPDKVRVFWKQLKIYVELKKSRKFNIKNRIYLIGTPDHGNLGDQAIAYAEIDFLRENCSDFYAIEIQFQDVYHYIKLLKKLIKKDDVIALHGGGNIGIEYMREEKLRRDVIMNFKNQKIIIFPQTIYFDDSEIGKREFENTRLIYGAHPFLTMVAREKRSYEIMAKHFKNNQIILTPDIVMYLNKCRSHENRSGILLCFRNDRESIVKDTLKKQIYDYVSVTNDVKIMDTSLEVSVSKKNRENELNKIWSSFRKSELVVTDRLHGLVFAAITGTPCIALNNYNKKVQGTFEWLSHLPYIKFIENENEILSEIDGILKLNNCDYNNNFALKYYEEIASIINISQNPFYNETFNTSPIPQEDIR